MLALALHYLNGWAMAAADGARKERAEWPPHPDRVFMALAAAHFETDDGDKAAERAALEWLEALPPPMIDAAPHTCRRVVTHYVPVNDAGLSGRKRVTELAGVVAASADALKDAGLAQLPEFRGRQPRSFPVAIPAEPITHLIWPDADPPTDLRAALAELCHKVTHVGHSASLVAACLVDAPPAPKLVPGNALGGTRLRVPTRGRLAHLAARGDRARAIAWADANQMLNRLKTDIKTAKGADKKALKAHLETQEAAMARDFPDGAPVATLNAQLFRPDPAGWHGYGLAATAAAPETPHSLFDPRLIVLALSGHRYGLQSTLKATALLRNACLAGCPEQPPPEWLSGHRADGRPTSDPHVAFVPLPFVDALHADGRLMGLALALPRELAPAVVGPALGPLFYDATGEPADLHLYDGPWFEAQATLEPNPRPAQHSLRLPPWLGPARRWASVTPVVFDRHFDGVDRWARAEESIKTACERIGLPRPVEVALHPVSPLVGVPRASDFSAMTRKGDGGRMHHSHVSLLFSEPVQGPVLIGAGRFRGYGLCRPLPGDGSND